MIQQMTVSGMSCEHCVKSVTDALVGAGLANVSVDLASGVCTFDPTDLSGEALTAAIEDIGFDVEAIS